MNPVQTRITPQEFLGILRDFSGGRQQEQSMLELYCAIEQAAPQLLSHSSGWSSTWHLPRSPQPNPIPVREFAAFSSAVHPPLVYVCAQLALFHQKLRNADGYDALLDRYGREGSIGANLNALRSLGLVANIQSDGTARSLAAIIDSGYPVGVYWHDRGNIQAPNPQGTWSLVHGYDDDAWHVIDFDGKAELMYGHPRTFDTTDSFRYGFEFFNRRWLYGNQPGLMLTAR